MKLIRPVTIFLGGSLFMFGFLKFFPPFREWYAIQISASGLGQLSYILGIAGELTTGLSLLIVHFFQNRVRSKSIFYGTAIPSIAVVVMMIIATYVHLHPDVPDDVLPLKIKPPFIPMFFVMAGLLNFGLAVRDYNHTGQK